MRLRGEREERRGIEIDRHTYRQTDRQPHIEGERGGIETDRQAITDRRRERESGHRDRQTDNHR